MEEDTSVKSMNFIRKTIKEFTDFFTGKYEPTEEEKGTIKRSGSCRCCRGCGDCGRGKL